MSPLNWMCLSECFQLRCRSNKDRGKGEGRSFRSLQLSKALIQRGNVSKENEWRSRQSMEMSSQFRESSSPVSQMMKRMCKVASPLTLWSEIGSQCIFQKRSSRDWMMQSMTSMTTETRGSRRCLLDDSELRSLMEMWESEHKSSTMKEELLRWTITQPAMWCWMELRRSW